MRMSASAVATFPASACATISDVKSAIGRGAAGPLEKDEGEEIEYEEEGEFGEGAVASLVADDDNAGSRLRTSCAKYASASRSIGVGLGVQSAAMSVV